MTREKRIAKNILASELGIDEKLDKIPGGRADDMSIKDIAEKKKVDVGQIQKQVEKGEVIEKEHTPDLDIAREISLDHIVEFADYYDELQKAEKRSEKNEKKRLSE